LAYCRSNRHTRYVRRTHLALLNRAMFAELLQRKNNVGLCVSLGQHRRGSLLQNLGFGQGCSFRGVIGVENATASSAKILTQGVKIIQVRCNSIDFGTKFCTKTSNFVDCSFDYCGETLKFTPLRSIRITNSPSTAINFSKSS